MSYNNNEINILLLIVSIIVVIFATPAILHLDELTAIKSISELYKECYTISILSTRMIGNDIVNHALDSKTDRESQ